MSIQISPGQNPVFSGHTADRILSHPPAEMVVSLDLGLTQTRIVVSKERFTLPLGAEYALEALEESFSAPEDCVELLPDSVRKIYLYSEHTGKYYKLYQARENCAPTIIIGGATMHAIVDMNPWEDAREKVGALRPRGGVCLDTCFGLSYSAQLLKESGYDRVMTCEVDRNVLQVAAVNPWSRSAFDDDDIEIVHRDERDVLRECPNEHFAGIFHDPPTIHQAGELYGGDFYAELRRVLRPRGWMYHYVGEPGAKRGQDFTRGVIRRLQEAGFHRTSRRARGVVCQRRD